MIEWIFFLSFIAFIIIRLPIGFALGFSSLIYLVGSDITLQVIPQIMITTFDSFVLLAIPLFMLAGQLMNSGGITDKIFSFANKLVGHIKGGLSHVNVVASMIFAGMSGSAVADAAGLGQIEIKAMVEEGFDPDFSAAITAASSTIGPIIPPSIPFVIYGSLTGTSIGALFIAGAIPGLLMGLFLMFTCYIISVKRGYPSHKRASIKELAISFIKAVPSLLTPIIIIGGILFGVFTPTEAAAVAVIYALILGILIYKEIKLRDLLGILLDVGKNIASIMFIVSTATVFGWILTYQGIPQRIADLLLSITHNIYLILLLINLLLLLVGCFMETIAAQLVLIPVLVPIIDTLGIDRVQFGVIITLNLMIGLITPPVGVCLYIVSNIAKISFERTVKATLPFVLVLIIVLMLITYIPSISTFLPKLLLN